MSTRSTRAMPNCGEPPFVNTHMGRLDRLHAWATAKTPLQVFTMVVRVLLALAFVPSGLVKIVGQPFTKLPPSDPVGHFFAGFFSAYEYYQFIGVAQWIAGGLLLIPRTATLGALVYLPIIVNIFAITIAIGPAFSGTRVVTGAMLAANLYLLAWDWDRWKHIIPSPTAARERHGALIPAIAMTVAAGAGLWGVMQAHLAWLRDGSVAAPLATVAAAASLGLGTLIVTYRGASR